MAKDEIIANTLSHACAACMDPDVPKRVHRAASITTPHPHINTIYASISVLHGVYFSASLFVNGNGGAPKGR